MKILAPLLLTLLLPAAHVRAGGHARPLRPLPSAQSRQAIAHFSHWLRTDPAGQGDALVHPILSRFASLESMGEAGFRAMTLLEVESSYLQKHFNPEYAPAAAAILEQHLLDAEQPIADDLAALSGLVEHATDPDEMSLRRSEWEALSVLSGAESPILAKIRQRIEELQKEFDQKDASALTVGDLPEAVRKDYRKFAALLPFSVDSQNRLRTKDGGQLRLSQKPLVAEAVLSQRMDKAGFRGEFAAEKLGSIGRTKISSSYYYDSGRLVHLSEFENPALGISNVRAAAEAPDGSFILGMRNAIKILNPERTAVILNMELKRELLDRGLFVAGGRLFVLQHSDRTGFRTLTSVDLKSGEGRQFRLNDLQPDGGFSDGAGKVYLFGQSVIAELDVVRGKFKIWPAEWMGGVRSGMVDRRGRLVFLNSSFERVIIIDPETGVSDVLPAPEAAYLVRDPEGRAVVIQYDGGLLRFDYAKPSPSLTALLLKAPEMIDRWLALWTPWMNWLGSKAHLKIVVTRQALAAAPELGSRQVLAPQLGINHLAEMVRSAISANFVPAARAGGERFSKTLEKPIAHSVLVPAKATSVFDRRGLEMLVEQKVVVPLEDGRFLIPVRDPTEQINPDKLHNRSLHTTGLETNAVFKGVGVLANHSHPLGFSIAFKGKPMENVDAHKFHGGLVSAANGVVARLAKRLRGEFRRALRDKDPALKLMHELGAEEDIFLNPVAEFKLDAIPVQIGERPSPSSLEFLKREVVNFTHEALKLPKGVLLVQPEAALRLAEVPESMIASHRVFAYQVPVAERKSELRAPSKDDGSSWWPYLRRYDPSAGENPKASLLMESAMRLAALSHIIHNRLGLITTSEHGSIILHEANLNPLTTFDYDTISEPSGGSERLLDERSQLANDLRKFGALLELDSSPFTMAYELTRELGELFVETRRKATQPSSKQP